MELHVNQLGEGKEYVVILHGLYGSGDNWLTIGRKLSEEYTVLLIDQRNHGKSGWDNDMSYQAMARDIADTLKANKTSSAHLLGHSMGGKSAMHFALLYPELCRSLFIVDMGVRSYNVDGHRKLLDIMMSLKPERFTKRKEIEDELSGMIPEASIRLFLLKNIYRQADKTFGWRINLSVLSLNIDEIGMSLKDFDTAYEGPTTFVGGANSDYLNVNDLESLRSYFSASELIFIEEAGHWVHADKPLELMKAFQSHLKKK